MFAPPLHSTPPPGLVSKLVHADFDRDGDEDVAFLSEGQFQARRNDGLAGFAAPVVLSTTSGIIDYVVTDIDRDGWPDLATTMTTQSAGPLPTNTVYAQVWRNTGAAAGFVAFTNTSTVLLSPAAVGFPFATLVAADFDADGLPDLAVHDRRGTCWVLRGAGSHGVPSGTLLPAVGYPVGPTAGGSLLSGDVNLDGAIDLLLTTNINSVAQTTVLEGQRGPQGRPLGTFGPLHMSPAPGVSANLPGTASCADFDGDGLLDVLLADPTGTILIRNLGGFTFAPPLTFVVPGVAPINMGRAFAGDFDRDGRLDIAVPSETHYAFAPFNFHVLSDPLGAAVWSSQSVDIGYPRCGAAIDVDNDGVLDALIGKNYYALTTARGTCSVLPVPVVTVVQPNGGQLLLAGQQTTIQWTATTPIASFDVDVSMDDGVTWTPVARRVTGTSCPWWVHEPSTNRARFRVMPTGLPVFADASDGPVTIGGPGLAAAVPLGGACGQPFAPSANATVPHLGGSTRLELVGASPNVLAAWWGSLPVVPPLPLGSTCLVWLDPAALSLLALGSTDNNGRFAVDLPVPGNPALQGFVLAGQATAFVPASAFGLQISNGVGLVLGY